MVQNVIKNKYLDFNCGNSEKILDNVKNYINKFDCPEMTLDLTALNILDATKVMVLSSAYHYQKYPEGKVKCRVQSENIKSFADVFLTNNLQIVK